MMAIVWVTISYIGTGLIWFFLSIVSLKVIWNIGLPYAMMRDPHRAWSIFPLIEIVPLGLALLVSWMTQQEGMLSPLQLGTGGAIAILVSYLHLAIVAILYGLVKWILEHSWTDQTKQ